MTSEQAQDAFMEWSMRDVYKSDVPESTLWWDAFEAVWNLVSRTYAIDAMWCAATGDPLPSGYIFPASAEMRAEWRAHFIAMGCVHESWT